MSKSVIAIDIDDVLALRADIFLDFVNKEFGSSLTLHDLSEDWVKMWGISRAEAERRGEVIINKALHGLYPVIPGAQEAIKLLQQQFRLIAVTSRRALTKDLTEEWLARHFPNSFEKIIHAGFWDDPDYQDGHLKDKTDIYGQIGAQYVIDDQPKHCIAAAKAGHTALLFGDYPWTQNVGLIPNLVAVKDWRAVQEYFNGRN